MEVLKQDQYSPLVMERQVIDIFTAQQRYLDVIDRKEILSYLDKQWEYVNNTHKEIIDELVETKVLSDDLRSKLKTALDEFATINKE